ncbi:undecaprenyl/decaprenyl-phosphate alpha-N-acetylglucosaminyl 1-phosphate transferase, partial [bacterium]|nr:undecaprenyl/decaprenyl-phosphate alpha-N-acetylglucosaminyl 1-phosphate transferase [bacterium]
IIAFIVLGFLGFRVGNPVVTLVAAAVVGAIFGFLRFNTYPATIFMGDAGSQLLGFLAIVLAIQLTQNNIAISPALPLLFLGFPILDTLTVMLARIYHGKSPFSADKNHFHHKLMRLGLSHSEAVLAIYLLQVVLVLTAYGMRYCSDWLILGGYLVFCTVVSLFFFLSAHFGWRLKRRQEGEFNELQKRLIELDKLTFMLKTIFRLLQVNFGLVLLIVTLPSTVVPTWLAWVSVISAGLLLVSLVRHKSRKFHNILLRLSVYFTLPVMVYNRAISKGLSGAGAWWCDYGIYGDVAYFTLVLLSLLLLKFTRRSGYKSTPLDFLILGVVLLVPVITPQPVAGVSMGAVAVKIIALFFAFEVIIEESRRWNWGLDLVVVGSLFLVGLKWL